MPVKTNGAMISCKEYPSPNPKVRLQEVTYWSDGLQVKGMLAEPKAEGRYDGLLYLRGGIQHVGMVRPARIAQFASHGLVVFAPYYRGNRGGEGKDEFAGDDRNDAVAGVEVLKQQRSVDSERIHLFSFSRGGIMALWTAIMREDLTSMVTWAGVSDVVFTYKEREDMRRMMKRVIGGTPNSQPDAYRERTALFRVQDIDIPILLIHGTMDTNVSFEQALLLENGLRDANKVYETWYLEGYTHYIPPEMNRQLVKDAVAWMKRQGH